MEPKYHAEEVIWYPNHQLRISLDAYGPNKDFPFITFEHVQYIRSEFLQSLRNSPTKSQKVNGLFSLISHQTGLVGGWTNPNWKIWVKMGIFPR